MAVVNKFNVNKQQVTLDADIIENMSANDISYNDSTQYDENTVGDKLNKLSELESQMIYDVTTNNNGATFASLSTLLSDENLSTLIPVSVRCGGMTIRFVQSSDNKYVQYRYMSTSTANADIANVNNWQSQNNKDIIKPVENILSFGNVELFEGFWHNNNKFNYSGVWSNSELIPIYDRGYIYLTCPSSFSDNRKALCFYDSNKNEIASYQFINTLTKVPTGSYYFSFTVTSEIEFKVYQVSDDSYSLNDSFHFNEINTENKELIGTFSYGSINTPSKDGPAYGTLTCERAYKDYYLHVTSIDIFIKEDAVPLGNLQRGIYLQAVEQKSSINYIASKYLFVPVANFTPNAKNTISVDFWLKPNQMLCVLYVGGVIRWGGKFTGKSRWIRQPVLGLNNRVDYYDAVINNIPSSNENGFMSYTYDVYKYADLIPRVNCCKMNI